MQELWKPVLDYDGLYEVSNLGRVRSVGRYVNTARGKRFKKENTNYGTANARRAEKLSVSKCKQVAQILNGKIISVFPSTISAKHIADPGHISACALGKRASAGGYVWQYI